MNIAVAAPLPLTESRPIAMDPRALLLTGAWLVVGLGCGVAAATITSPLPVLALLALPLLALCVRHRRIGALFLLFLLYTRISDVGIAFHNLPSLAQPFTFVLGGITFIARTRAGSSRSLGTQRWIWGAMLLYASVLLGSSIWAVDAPAAVTQATDLLKNLVIVYIVVESLDSPRLFRLALWSLIAAGALLAALTVFQAVTHTYDHSYGGLAQAPIRQITIGSDNPRSSGPVGDPNFYGLILTALLPLAMARARYEEGPGTRTRVLRLVAGGAAVLLLAAIALTFSRGALLSCIAVSALFIPLAQVRPRHVAMAALCLLPLAALAPASYWDRLSLLAGALPGVTAQTDNSVRYRAGAVAVAVAMFEAHPLLGVGADNYPTTYLPYAMRLNTPEAASRSHDFYLQVAAETGLAGLLTFGGAMLLTLRAVWHRRATAVRDGDRAVEGLATSCLLSLLAYLIGCAFLPAAYSRYLWLLIGMAMAAALLDRAAPRPTIAQAVGGGSDSG